MAYNNLAGILKMTSRLAECIQCYEHVVFLQVGRPPVRQAGANPRVPACPCTASRDQAAGEPLAPRPTCALSSGPAWPPPAAPPPCLQPQSPEAYANLASALKDCGRHDEALVAYRQSLHLKPDFPEVGAVRGRWPRARGLASGPSGSGANAHSRQQMHTGRCQMLTQSLRRLLCSPDAPARRPPQAFANYVHSLQCVCEWRDRPALFARHVGRAGGVLGPPGSLQMAPALGTACKTCPHQPPSQTNRPAPPPACRRLEQEVRRDVTAGRLPSVQPFHAMAYPFPADLALAIGAQYAQVGAALRPALVAPCCSDARAAVPARPPRVAPPSPPPPPLSPASPGRCRMSRHPLPSTLPCSTA